MRIFYLLTDTVRHKEWRIKQVRIKWHAKSAKVYPGGGGDFSPATRSPKPMVVRVMKAK